MKVLIVSQFFYPESFRINNLAEDLVKRGHDVTVLTGQPNYPQGNIFAGYGNFKKWHDEYKGIKIIRVPIFPRKRGSSLSLILNYLSFVLSASILGLPRVGKPEVCLVWSSSPITSALPAVFYRFFRKIPVAIWIQDLWPESFSAITKLRSSFFIVPLAHLVKFIYKRCDQIWIQSQAFTKSVLGHGADLQKLRYMPNWAEDFYDRENYSVLKSPVTQLQVAQLDEAPELNGFSILFAGNIGKAQALPTILAAAEILRETPELKWFFVGDGSQKVWLAEEIRKRNLDDKIKILRARTPQEMPALFKQAKVLLVSLHEDPTFDLVVPSKVQSYLASGKPILGSLGGEGARIITESGSGLVAPAEDANGLAQRALELIKLTDDEREKMGRSAYVLFSSQFRMQSLIDKAESFLISLAQESL